MILLAVSAAQQFSGGCNMQRHIALQLCRANDKYAGGNQHSAAAILVAGVNRGLQRRGVDSGAVSFRAKLRMS